MEKESLILMKEPTAGVLVVGFVLIGFILFILVSAITVTEGNSQQEAAGMLRRKERKLQRKEEQLKQIEQQLKRVG